MQRQKFGNQLVAHKVWYSADYDYQTNLLNVECGI